MLTPPRVANVNSDLHKNLFCSRSKNSNIRNTACPNSARALELDRSWSGSSLSEKGVDRGTSLRDGAIELNERQGGISAGLDLRLQMGCGVSHGKSPDRARRSLQRMRQRRRIRRQVCERAEQP